VEERRSRGTFFTPAQLADEVAAATLGPLLEAGRDPTTVTVCDPAVGGGALLLAAARHLVGAGADLRRLVAGQLVGVDVDPLAVEVARTSLAILAILGESERPATSTAPAAERTRVPARTRAAAGTLAAGGTGSTSATPVGRAVPAIVEGDALRGFPLPVAGGYDAVLANPPFLNQLRRRTARGRAEAAALAERFGEASAGYADTANLFLLLALELVRPGGRVGIILPEPTLATRDGRETRRRVGQASSLQRLWRPGRGAFDAGVRVCVAVLERAPGGEADGRPADASQDPAGLPAPGGTAIGRSEDRAWSSGQWAIVAARDGATPGCELDSDGVLGDLAHATADFRDQYYGVTAVALDDPEPGPDPSLRPRLVTCGLLDPARVGWGERPARLARQRLLHPRADLARLATDHAVRAWAVDRLVPKVLLATQTRILEAAVDEHGEWLPVVPVISVTTDPDLLWHVLAALTAPPVAALAHRCQTGAALSPDAIKLSAREIACLPLPARRDAWDAGAAAARRATEGAGVGDAGAWREALGELGLTMCAAYRVDADAVLPWWEARLDAIAGRIDRQVRDGPDRRLHDGPDRRLHDGLRPADDGHADQPDGEVDRPPGHRARPRLDGRGQTVA